MFRQLNFPCAVLTQEAFTYFQADKSCSVTSGGHWASQTPPCEATFMLTLHSSYDSRIKQVITNFGQIFQKFEEFCFDLSRTLFIGSLDKDKMTTWSCFMKSETKR